MHNSVFGVGSNGAIHLFNSINYDFREAFDLSFQSRYIKLDFQKTVHFENLKYACLSFCHMHQFVLGKGCMQSIFMWHWELLYIVDGTLYTFHCIYWLNLAIKITLKMEVFKYTNETSLSIRSFFVWFRQSLFVKVWVWAAIFRVSALVLCSQNLSRELLLALQILTRPEPPPFKFRFGSNSKSGWIILQLHVNIKIGIALEFSKAQIVLCNKWFFSRTWILLWTLKTV